MLGNVDEETTPGGRAPHEALDEQLQQGLDAAARLMRKMQYHLDVEHVFQFSYWLGRAALVVQDRMAMAARMRDIWTQLAAEQGVTVAALHRYLEGSEEILGEDYWPPLADAAKEWPKAQEASLRFCPEEVPEAEALLRAAGVDLPS
jgi:hypothetical protein